MNRILAILIVALLAVCQPDCGMAQKRTSSAVKKERQEAKKKVTQTKQQIQANQKKISNQLNELNALEAEINNNKSVISGIEAEIRRLDREIAAVRDSIRSISADIKRIKESSAKSLRESRTRRQSLSSLAMIFSSESFAQAVKRAGYLQQLDKSRAKKAKTLTEKLALLDAKRARLEELRRQRAASLQAKSDEQAKLEKNQRESERMVTSLRKEGKALEKELNERQRRASALDRELDNIIAEEQRIAAEQERKRQEEERKRQEEERRRQQEAERKRQEQEAAAAAAAKEKQPGATPAPKPVEAPAQKPADKPAEKPAEKTPPAATPAKMDNKQIAADFAKAKGTLPFPVSGSYSVVGTFGRTKHADLSKVEVENSGIDIQTQKGAKAQAVYPGTVSSIFQLDGYHNVVMVRHGEYITIYANIDKLSVKKGDSVAAGQALGSIYSDSRDGDRTILHFEVRKERDKLNPLDWLKR